MLISHCGIGDLEGPPGLIAWRAIIAAVHPKE
jgi:hypothetical protein